MVFPKSLSQVDRTVLYTAKKNEAMVISSDKLVRNFSRGHSIEYHGMLWLFDKMIEFGFLSRKDAAQKLKELISMNTIYQDNKSLMEELFGRIHEWGKWFLLSRWFRYYVLINFVSIVCIETNCLLGWGMDSTRLRPIYKDFDTKYFNSILSIIKNNVQTFAEDLFTQGVTINNL